MKAARTATMPTRATEHDVFNPFDPEFQRGIAIRAHAAFLQSKLMERLKRIYAPRPKPAPAPAPAAAIAPEPQAAPPNYGQHGV